MYLSGDPRKYYLLNPDIYCIAKKPFGSLNFIFYGSIKPFFFEFHNSFNFDDSSVKDLYTKQCAYLKTPGFPLISLCSFPKGNSYQASLYDNYYQILLQYLNGSASVDIRYDMFDFLSLYFSSKKSSFRIFPILKIEKFFILTDFEITNSSMVKTVKSLAFKFPILSNKLTFAVENPQSFITNPRYSISDQIDNFIINFYFTEFSKTANCCLHCKYKFENGNKIGVFVDFDDDSLFIRGSTFNILNIFKIKISCKITHDKFALSSFRIDCNI